MTGLWRSRRQAEFAAERLRKFAQPQRLMILSHLLAGEASVTEIDAATGIGQPALSQQLAELRKAGLVTTRREAKQVHYRLAGESVALCVRSVEAMFGADEPGRAPREVPRQVSQEVRTASAGLERGAAHFARLR